MVQQRLKKSVTKKKWTVMVYLAGDNNLDGAGVADLQEMKQVGSSTDVNIVAQFDRAGSTHATKRYYITKGGSLGKDVVGTLGETNTGDPKVLEDFIKWGAAKYRADRYLVVIWNHGAGWDDTDVYRTARRDLRLGIVRKDTVIESTRGGRGSVSFGHIRAITSRKFRRALFRTPVEQALTARAIALDDNAEDFLDSLEMKKALGVGKKALGQKIDVLGMDACLMNMAEVAKQIENSVQVMVGSEEVEPGDGWPYHTILKELVKRPQMTAQDLSKVIVRKYLASYVAKDVVTQSTLNLADVDAVVKAVDGLSQALRANLSDASVRTAIMKARDQAQSYYVPDYVDLIDLCELLKQHAQRQDIATACQTVVDTVTNGFVIASGFKGPEMRHSHGVSIYFPTQKVSPLYARLDFAKSTAWDEFLNEYQMNRRRRAN